ncbi:hypothetical protein DFP72DRAFT_492194 [Ephemerocybe angulata]|uniref:Uncharacterized protein n=1 Tax=Ephemerocybe angulata TaxID=980116 RepID=A0A8H6IED6_9AGAR|nr:hypothetical protein DFP72DRAFT_492194 [Tulosesus angulatus]
MSGPLARVISGSRLWREGKRDPPPQRGKRSEARLPARSRIQDRPSRRTPSRFDPSSPPPKPRATISGAVLDLRSPLKLTVSDPRVNEEPTYEATRCQPQIRAHSERNILTRAYFAGLESKTSRRGTSNDVNKSRNANIATFIDVTHSTCAYLHGLTHRSTNSCPDATAKQFRPRFPPWSRIQDHCSTYLDLRRPRRDLDPRVTGEVSHPMHPSLPAATNYSSPRSGATVIETIFSAPSCKVSNPIPSLEVRPPRPLSLHVHLPSATPFQTHMLTSSFEPPVPGFKSGNIRDGLGFEGGDQEVALEFEGAPKSYRGGTSSSSLITVHVLTIGRSLSDRWAHVLL